MTNISNSNKKFGILFFLIFFLYGVWPALNSSEVRIWALLISLVFLILGLTNSKILSPLYKYWIKLGEFLGIIISPLVMAIVYFAVITPIAIIIRILGKDLLKVKFSKSSTYWINRTQKLGPMKRQF
jgi:hypothetical protein